MSTREVGDRQDEPGEISSARSSCPSAGAERERALQRRVEGLDALYRLTDRLYRSETLSDSYEAALDAILEALACTRASILLFDEDGVMRFVAWRGLSDAYRQALSGHSPWQAGDRDPEPIFVEDIDGTAEPDAVKARIRAEGIRALAFIPLVEKGRVIGKFMAYHDVRHDFDAHERDIAVTIARQLGFRVSQARADEARLAAQEALRKTHERLLLAARTGKVGLWEWDVVRNEVSWTDAIYAIHGVERETFDATVEGFASLVHPDDRAAVDEAIRRALEEDAPYELEFRAVRPDGEVVWLFTNAFVLREGGRAACMVGATCDITERKRAEASLRESEKRFRLMSEQAPVMIWLSDAQGRCLHLNRALRTFWNVDEADLAAFDWQTTMHPDDAPEIGRQIMDALTRRASVTIRGRYTDSAGRYRVLETTARPRHSEEGEFLGMIGVNVDITAHEEAAQALRESEERFRLAVEAAPSGMVLVDGDGRIVLMNRQAETLFGYGRDELVGASVETLVPERFRKAHPGFRRHFGQAPTPRPMGGGRELCGVRSDGSEVPVEIGLSPFDTEEGPMVLAAIIDISERKAAEAQRELLLGELNHRVKNTLAVVQGIAFQTFRSTDDLAAAQEAFAGRLGALSAANNLLTQSNWEPASLEPLIHDVFMSLGVGGERVVLAGPRVRLPSKAAMAVSLSLHELATNAMKYGALSNGEGTIDIAWRIAGAPPARLELEWRERGGPPVSPPARRGFGSRLIDKIVATDLRGEVSTDFRPEGLVVLVTMPLADDPACTSSPFPAGD